MRKYQLKKSVFAAMGILSIAVVAAGSCQKKGKEESLRPATAGILATCADTISVPVDANGLVTISRLTANKIWKLNGISYVGNGQTLTIDPGTTVVSGAPKNYFDFIYGTKSVAGVLIVGRGGKLIADGKVDSVIVFTTLRSLGCTTGSCDTAGFGPSIVIMGKATTNRVSATKVEGIPQPAAVDITYGAGYTYDNADNSGILEYVRIEFPGSILSSNNEINGLTLVGVGAGTKISHVQVSYSIDDAFQFFGGTVNCDHLVAIGSNDDDYDFVHGYTGTIDYAIGLKDPGSTHSVSGAASACDGIESDNGSGGSTAPLTNPVLRHFTILGYANNFNASQLRKGGYFRNATALDMEYSIFGGYQTGVEFTGISNPTGVISNFSNNVIQGYASAAILSPSPISYAGNFTLASLSNANNYLLLGPNAFAQPFLNCNAAASYDPANLVPRSTSPAFGTASTYKGAFQPGVTVWTANWTKFNSGFCCIS